MSEAGYRVLLIDMDPQGSLTVWSGRNPDELENTMYESLIKGLDSREILLPTHLGPDLLPANIDLSLAEMELIGTVARERRLGGVLAPLRDDYDFILMDAQPSLGLLTVNVFAAADEILVPVVAEFLSTRAVDVLMRMMKQVQLKLNSRLKLVGFVPTMFDARLRHARAELEELEQRFGDVAPVLTGCTVPRSVRFAEAAAAGRSMLQFLPLHPGSEAYRRLARYLTGETEVGLATTEETASSPHLAPDGGTGPDRPSRGWRPFADDGPEEASATGGKLPMSGETGMPEPVIDVFVRKQDEPRRRRR